MGRKKKPKIKQNELFCLRYSYSGALLLENKSLLIETPISGIVLVVRMDQGFYLGTINIWAGGVFVVKDEEQRPWLLPTRCQ